MSAVPQEYRADANSLTRKLSLHAVLPQHVLLSQLENGFIASPAEPISLLNAWERASVALSQGEPALRSFLASDDIQAIQGVEEHDLESTLRRAKLYSPFDTHRVALYEVNISKLITPQITLNVGRAAQRAAITPGMTAADVFRVAFEVTAQPAPITRQVLGMSPNAGSVLFTSFDEDIRLHHPPVYQAVPVNIKDGKSARLESVCLPVGGGLGFAHAYRVEIGNGVKRLFLMNGIHRIYELAKAGFQTAPIAVCDLQLMELPDQVVDLPKQMLVDLQANPPLVTDFLNRDVVLELDYFRVLRTVRLNWSFEQYVTVLR